LSDFVDEFFDQNPISQLGLLVAKNKRAEVLSDLTGNIQKLKDGLNAVREAGCDGEFSLQNALRVALQTLKYPSHSSREMLIICSSLSTCDPDDIMITLKELKKLKIRCSFICLAEVYVFKLISEETSGTYSVLLDEEHLKNVLWTHAIPPVVPVKDLDSNLIRMGNCTVIYVLCNPLHSTFYIRKLC
uniref:Ssl1 domain-containing protein n=1 Tax=Soboliphyme baturini TaxID=241478 RepID=A0A183J839_9BILA